MLWQWLECETFNEVGELEGDAVSFEFSVNEIQLPMKCSAVNFLGSFLVVAKLDAERIMKQFLQR